MANFFSRLTGKGNLGLGKILKEEYSPYNKHEKKIDTMDMAGDTSYIVKNWMGDDYVESITHKKKNPID